MLSSFRRRENGGSERLSMYLATIQCKHKEMEEKIRERTLKGRCVIGSLAKVMTRRNVYMEVKRGLRNSILQTLMYESETWTWNKTQQSRVRAMEIIYLRGACGVIRWEGESN